MIVAWVLRDFATPILQKIPWIVKDVTQAHVDEWFGQQAVYRVSMGNFLFFSCMSLALVGVKTKGDKRDRYLHHGHPLLKLGVWLLFTALPFLFPNELLHAYSWLARIGSGVFLVIQMIILLDFVQAWNESWVAAGEEDERWLYGLMALTVGAYAGTLTLAGLMYHWFKPAGAGSCSLNIALITLTLLLAVGFSMLSLTPVVRQGSIFPASVISLYAAYLCFSALQSEPRDYACNGLAHRLTAASGGTLALGMLVTLASVVYAAFRAGSNTSLFTLDGSEEGEPVAERQALLSAEEGTSAGLDGVPDVAEATREAVTGGATRVESPAASSAPVSYNYSFFHLIFALASMYIAMLMTGWGSVAQEKDRIDVGWSSVWVKTAAQWATGLLYCWTLLAPALFPDRDFS
ncbi:hypothetical protein GPECTOR_51g709 [Gonium pectorale]|uniref:Serine incorporator n=1 Tax=Gonium pectorale TaxID=33097 RepID=A0A150G7H7_GONPE|nr:hypothetical protein GPECTOR_51g709 [Gonium pectorale]|eukprot:KXZ45723.1 hypothetical protein GPECTOR_51g709 [Gonium pectorale]